MSILVVEVLSEGMIFGADRNITTTYSNGTTVQEISRPKVFKWPKDDVLVGAVGAATVNGLPIEEWLNTLTEEFRQKTSLEEIAKDLNARIQEQRSKDEGTNPATPMIIHLGGFEKKDGLWLPYIWFIRNTHKPGQFRYLDFRKEFSNTEEFWKYFKDVDPTEIRKVLKVLAKQFKPFWFHQGIDLFTFNVLESAIKSSFKLLCEQHPDHDIPTTLEGWSKHVYMQVLMYGAYYEAFHPEGKRYVGGGADVIFTHWPN